MTDTLSDFDFGDHEHDDDKSDRWQRLEDDEQREQDELDRKRAHDE